MEKGDRQTQEQGLLNPENKDLECHARDQEQQMQGIWQKVWSVRIRLVPVLVVAAAAIIVVIVLSVLYVRETHQSEGVKCLLRQCPNDWILYNGKCYYFSDKYHTWNDSQKVCESNSSSLAVIDNEKELNFLYMLKSQFSYWIGLSRKQDDSGWVWNNGIVYADMNISRKPIIHGDSENVLLNGKGFTSENGRYTNRFICSNLVNPNHNP